MSSLPPELGRVKVTTGDVLKSKSQTLVNTVNCVGVMGKGIALAFKRRYPEMFKDYVRRCDAGEVRLGRPYVYQAHDHLIVNFPTKEHWRSVSRLEDIVAGLEYLTAHYRQWGITSIAVPPLGCGNGQLEWAVVGPTLMRHLARLDVPVELYAPHGETVDPEQLTLDANEGDEPTRPRFLEPEWVAVTAILDRLERQPHHWQVGRIFFQKLAYFATQAGIPTGLAHEAGSYGPFASELNRNFARMQNNGLTYEQRRGQMIAVRVGPTYPDAVEQFRDQLEAWRPAIERTVDLLARMDTRTAEIAASVHYSAGTLAERFGRRPTSTEVVDAVARWKRNRKPPVARAAIVEALAVLALRGWLDVELDEAIEPMVEDLVTA